MATTFITCFVNFIKEANHIDHMKTVAYLFVCAWCRIFSTFGLFQTFFRLALLKISKIKKNISIKFPQEENIKKIASTKIHTRIRTKDTAWLVFFLFYFLSLRIIIDWHSFFLLLLLDIYLIFCLYNFDKISWKTFLFSFIPLFFKSGVKNVFS